MSAWDLVASAAPSLVSSACASCPVPSWWIALAAGNFLLVTVLFALACCFTGCLSFAAGYAVGRQQSTGSIALPQGAAESLAAAGEATIAAAIGAGRAACAVRQRVGGYHR